MITQGDYLIIPPAERLASCVFQFAYSPNSWNRFVLKYLQQIKKLLPQVLKVITLRPMVRIIIKVAEVAAVCFLPICECRFHADNIAYNLFAG